MVQNQGNRCKKWNSRSKFKGVVWIPERRKWEAVGDSSRNKHMGVFKTEEEAAAAYNAYAIKKYGEFALLNPL